MDHIETEILNCIAIREAEQHMVFTARLTQHGHTIRDMKDLLKLYQKSFSNETLKTLHPFRILRYRNLLYSRLL